MGFPLIPILSTAFGIGSQIWNTNRQVSQSRYNTERTIQANKELAEYAYSRDLEMWNRQNLYNRPEEQMKRLKEAGLNPNLVYGTGSVSGNTSTQMPKYNAPTVDYSGNLPMQLPNMISMYQDIALRGEQINNAKQVVEQNQLRTMFDRDTLQWRTKAEHRKLRNLYKKFGVMSKQTNLMEVQRSLIQKQLSEKDYDIIFKKYRNDWMKHGITSSDSVIFRMMINALQNSGLDLLNLNAK